MNALAAILLLAIGVAIGVLLGRASATRTPSESHSPAPVEAASPEPISSQSDAPEPAASSRAVAEPVASAPSPQEPPATSHVVRRPASTPPRPRSKEALDPDILDAPNFFPESEPSAALLEAPDTLDVPDFLSPLSEDDEPFTTSETHAKGELVSPDFFSGLGSERRERARDSLP
ncbi:MAG: hypothetical protein H6741_11755 [Alphaproteobacteria bacterium]|nr:hypothetical protein [Alphaproteobacteria bacterium]MCB9793386.1 hypothetical protein [Alphaproteobacteria bacterium]